MTGKLTRLSKSILEQPQLIMQSRFEEIAAVLDNHEGYSKLAEAAQAAHDKQSTGYGQEDLVETTVGVLRIEGALTYKPTGFESLCGGTSYQSLLEQTKQLCAMPNVNTILMDVDSGGGMAFRMMETAREIRSLCDTNGKYLIAYVDGVSASAGFGLTSVAHEVIMNPESQVGSIGAVVRLVNTNQAQKAAGISTTYITAGDSKVPFDKEGEFREDFLADIQESITILYDNFVSHVATTRDISEDVVRNTEAKMFGAEKALSLGLVDKVMEGEEFYTYLADLNTEDKVSTSTPVQTIKLETTETVAALETDFQSTESTSKMTDQAKADLSVDAVTVAELQATMKQQADLIASFQAEKAQAALDAEKASLSESLSQYSFLAEDKEAVVSFLASTDVESAHKALLNNVIASAQASQELIKEQAQTDVQEAQASLEAANVAKDKIKDEFSTEAASTEVPAAKTQQELIVAKAAQRKAAKA